MTSDRRADVVVVVLEDGGGMSHYAANLAGALAGIIPTALYRIGSDSGLRSGGLVSRMIDALPLARRLRRHYNPLRMRRIATEIIDTWHPRLVHISSRTPMLRTLVRRLRASGIRVVHTIHDPSPHSESRTAWGSLHTWATYRWTLPAVMRACDAVHVHSTAHAGVLARRYASVPRSHYYVVEHGGGLTGAVEGGQLLAPELRRVVDRDRTALFFGRIQPYKGLAVLFEAARRIAASDANFRLVVAGAGQLPPVPAALSDSLVLINRFVADEEIRGLVEAAGFLVLPYTAATQTGVIAVAAALSRPVIATRVGSLPDLVVDQVTGLLCAPDDAEALAAAMRAMLVDADRTRHMGEEARMHLQHRYAWPLVARHHAEHYAAMLQQQAGRS